MAVYIPVKVWEKARDVISILRSEDRDGFTCYIIEVRVFPYKWQVAKRYRQFVELHEKMIKHYAINKSLLPPKKLIGNRSESFITERQKSLELYLHTLVHQFQLLPEPLALFLDFQKYEVRTITSVLSETLFLEGDNIITHSKSYKFTPLQLHAISERLKLGDPTCYSNNAKQDIAHLVEFITQLKHLKIVGNSQCIETSDIIPNNLSYELSMFKSIESLEIRDCRLEDKLITVECIRTRLMSLKIHHSLSDLSNFLLCDVLHWCPASDPFESWPFWSVTYANFSYNGITKIHPCVKLLSSVKHLDLSHNEIEIIENLETLSDLSTLILSHNKIQDIDSLHTRLGNVHSLNVSSNRIKCLYGLSKFFSVSELLLKNNFISSVSEVSHLSKLPCLEILNLQNNPVTFTVDYRSQLLLMFGSLASEITLDGLKATEKEIDTVSVLQALKEGRGETTSDSKHSGQLNEICSKIPASRNELIESSDKLGEQVFQGECASHKCTINSQESSKFRQHVENLRRVGGSDWLKLLNEMHCSPNQVNSSSYEVQESDVKSYDDQLHTTHSPDVNPGQLTSPFIKSFTYSFEISIPELFMSLDCTCQHFKERLRSICIQNNIFDEDNISNAKIFWAVSLESSENSIYETPICIALLETEMVVLKLINFSSDMLESVNCTPKLNPDFTYQKSVLSQDMFSIHIGPCNAYIELKVKTVTSLEKLTIFITNKVATTMFFSECENLYNIKSEYKENPFMNNLFDIEKLNFDIPVKKLSMEKQIIFSQRVCVSKSFHKCQHGILHYIFVTPSHVMLVEERLHYPQINGLDIAIKPQFQLCAFVNVRTNIKQIHLKDINSENDCESCYDPCTSKQTGMIIQENEKINFLYKCGSWLIMEFESNVLFYLNFFTQKQRTEFLDTFLGARSRR